jgi:hypothetical protein
MDGTKPTKMQDSSIQPINVQWNSPSCSTWSGENAGFGITASEFVTSRLPRGKNTIGRQSYQGDGFSNDAG